MARGATPKSAAVTLSKADILAHLQHIDLDAAARARILQLETNFRAKMVTLSANTLGATSILRKFNTNPFVLMAQSYHKGYTSVHEIENDIVVSKAFPSMETSVGRMVEAVALPVYGWSTTPSGMHTLYSVIDGELVAGGTAHFVTLKSGPRTMNDDVVRGLYSNIVDKYASWAADKGVQHIDIAIGILYGTYKQSNKKDWHILDEVRKAMAARGVAMAVSPDHRWDCAFSHGGVDVNISVRIGVDLWSLIGASPVTYLEICIALIRACITPSSASALRSTFTIADLAAIVSTADVLATYNVSLLQRSQMEWLFLLAHHFCDVLS